METLKPGADVNGSIINWYLKLLKYAVLPPETRDSTHFFSDFLMTKLIGPALESLSAND